MWNLILIIILVIMLSTAYLMHNKDYISASFFCIAGFLLSSIFSLINIDIWGLNVTFITVITIVSGLAMFVFGDTLGSRVKFRIKLKRKEYSEAECISDYIDIKFYVTLLSCIFMAIVDYYYFCFIYNLSVIRGNRFGIRRMFQYARYLIVDGTYDTSMPTILGHANLICECLGYLYLFVVIYNFISKKKIISFNLVPCILFIVNTGISTARFNFLKYFVASVFMTLIIMGHKEIKLKTFRFKTLVLGVLGFIALLCGFRMLGYLTGKSAVRSLWSDISIYTGSSVPALDYYLTNPKTPNKFFGKETLANVYKMLRRVNLTSVPPYDIPLPFIRLDNGRDTNVYTVFRRLIQDYGYIAMYFIMFFEGMFYGIFISKIKAKKEMGIGTIICAFMFYPVAFSCIEEKFILNFTAIDLLYHIVYFVIVYKIIIKKSVIFAGGLWLIEIVNRVKQKSLAFYLRHLSKNRSYYLRTCNCNVCYVGCM